MLSAGLNDMYASELIESTGWEGPDTLVRAYSQQSFKDDDSRSIKTVAPTELEQRTGFWDDIATGRREESKLQYSYD